MSKKIKTIVQKIRILSKNKIFSSPLTTTNDLNTKKENNPSYRLAKLQNAFMIII